MLLVTSVSFIALHIEQEASEVFGGEIEVDESYSCIAYSITVL